MQTFSEKVRTPSLPSALTGKKEKNSETMHGTFQCPSGARNMIQGKGFSDFPHGQQGSLNFRISPEDLKKSSPGEFESRRSVLERIRKHSRFEHSDSGSNCHFSRRFHDGPLQKEIICTGPILLCRANPERTVPFSRLERRNALCPGKRGEGSYTGREESVVP